MKVFLNRSSAISLQEQLASQLGQMVASGELPPGGRLPSIRALAQRLGIHHNTVMGAYLRLEALGVIELRKGSGTRVVEHRQARRALPEGLELHGLIRQLVQRARASGLGDQAIRDALDAALLERGAEQVAVVNPHPDLLQIYTYELSRALAVPVVGLTLEALDKLSVSERSRTLFVTSSNHAASVKGKLGGDNEPVLMQLASVAPLLNWARAIPPEGLLGIASASVRFRVLFREILSAVCSEPMLLDVALEATGPAPTGLKLVTHVLTDAESASRLVCRPQVTPFVFNLLGDEALAELARRMS